MPENETAPDDTEQDPPPAAEQPDTPSESDKGAEKDWAAEAEKWKSLARKHEGTAKQNADAAKRLAAFEDAQKSETQKLNDQLAEREVELQELRVERVRNKAGQDAKLDPDLWEFITASDPDEALAQAKRLVARTAPPEPGAANLRQGSRTPAKTAPNANDLLRGMAGYQ
jgi:hypothetical protein